MSGIPDMSGFSMLDLFREEVRTHFASFQKGLALWKSDLSNTQLLEPLMRAAHSVKGAAKIVDVGAAIQIAGALEDVLIEAMKGAVTLQSENVPLLSQCFDALNEIGEAKKSSSSVDISSLITQLQTLGNNLSATAAKAGKVAEIESLSNEAGGNVHLDQSLLELFREEVGKYSVIMTEGFNELEGDPGNPECFEPLLRSAHSIRAASKIVGVEAADLLAGALHEALLAVKDRGVTITRKRLALFRLSCDMLTEIAQTDEASFPRWMPNNSHDVQAMIERLQSIASGNSDSSETVHWTPGTTPAKGVRLPSPSEAIAKIVLAETSDFPARSMNPRHVTDSNTHDTTLGMNVEVSLIDLYREEVRGYTILLNEGFVELEGDLANSQRIEPLMRAAHSIKGAARIVNVEAAVQVAHVMEDALVAVQKGQIRLTSQDIDLFLRGTDLIADISQSSEKHLPSWLPKQNPLVADVIKQLAAVAVRRQSTMNPAPSTHVATSVSAAPSLTASSEPSAPLTSFPVASATVVSTPVSTAPVTVPATAQYQASPTMVLTAESLGGTNVVGGSLPSSATTEERAVRVTAQSLSRLMSLAGESLVEARWLQPFAKSLLLLKKHQDQLAVVLDDLHHSRDISTTQSNGDRLLSEARQQITECRGLLSDRIGEFETHAHQSDDLNSRLYHEVIATRMRPFADGIQGFPRMVRDLARKLGKKVKFEIVGHSTDVDRDILEKLEASLNHILRNSLDHGLETTEERIAAGKPEQGTLRLEARHLAGMLSITVTDDGRGISAERLRRKIMERGLATAELTAKMNDTELFGFLFLPGFSTAEKVTEVSGRGVGLDVVHNMVSTVGGSVRVSSKLGRGTTFHLQLPITLSVLRAVLVTVCDEPYAFPHNRIDRLLRLPSTEVRVLEGRHYFSLDGRNIGLVMAPQVFNLPANIPPSGDLCVVLISDHQSEYGVVVDRFRGEQDLVVRPLDRRLGKVPNVSAAALLEDGSPVLIVDVDDFLRSITNLLHGERLRPAQNAGSKNASNLKKRILVVDDSITVREAEKQLLINCGYEVETAVDGMDGWNAIRDADFDLVVSDIDMPRMNGLEFVKNIKGDARLKHTPVVIVSYKGREEDRLQGLDAGADYYLAKSSFHDETLIDAVTDLIGGPENQ